MLSPCIQGVATSLGSKVASNQVDVLDVNRDCEHRYQQASTFVNPGLPDYWRSPQSPSCEVLSAEISVLVEQNESAEGMLQHWRH